MTSTKIEYEIKPITKLTKDLVGKQVKVYNRSKTFVEGIVYKGHNTALYVAHNKNYMHGSAESNFKPKEYSASWGLGNIKDGCNYNTYLAITKPKELDYDIY